MSDKENHFIERYNFSRRVVDHRKPFDFNYAINQSSNPNKFFGAFSNKVKGNMVHYFGIYYVTWAAVNF